MTLCRWVSLVVTGLTVLVAGGSALPAAADPDPYGYMGKLSVDYRVSGDGSIDVTETIDYRFPARGSGYLSRAYKIREPYRSDERKDQVWQYTDFTASSPTGAATELRITELDPHQQGDDSSYDSREAELSVTFPHNDRPVTGAQYVLRYRIRGALRMAGSEAVLDRWTVASSRPGRIELAEVQLTAPGGVSRIACTGTSAHGCQARQQPDGSALFTASRLNYSAGISISAAFRPGAVQGGPILADPPSSLDKLGLGGVLGVLLAGAILLTPLVVWSRIRQRGDDAPTGWSRVSAAFACIAVGLLAGGVASIAVTAAADAVGAGLGALLYGFGARLLIVMVWVVWLCDWARLGPTVGWSAALLTVVAELAFWGEFVVGASVGLIAAGLVAATARSTDPARRVTEAGSR